MHRCTRPFVCDQVSLQENMILNIQDLSDSHAYFPENNLTFFDVLSNYVYSCQPREQYKIECGSKKRLVPLSLSVLLGGTP